MTTTKTATKTQVRKTLRALEEQTGYVGQKWGPQVHPYEPDLIIWEEGPYGWTYSFPYGGIEEEFGTRLADVSDSLPEGVWVEAQTHYSVKVWRDEA